MNKVYCQTYVYFLYKTVLPHFQQIVLHNYQILEKKYIMLRLLDLTSLTH